MKPNTRKKAKYKSQLSWQMIRSKVAEDFI